MSGRSPPIKYWDCSFYKNDVKKWVYGKLLLFKSFIEFHEEIKNSAVKRFVIYFSNISEINKVKSMLCYTSITLALNTEKIWLSSFSNRDEVFNTLEHFWRDLLIENRNPEKR